MELYPNSKIFNELVPVSNKRNGKEKKGIAETVAVTYQKHCINDPFSMETTFANYHDLSMDCIKNIISI